MLRMMCVILVVGFSWTTCLGFSEADAFRVERKIVALSVKINTQFMQLSEYHNLKQFCSNDTYRQRMFSLLDEMHYYHDQLEAELHSTTYNHSRRTIQRILKHMDKLDEKYHPDEFADFFRDQCTFQSTIESNAKHYKAGFGTHSYGSRVYAQEVMMYRYINRMIRKIMSIKKHVEVFYERRQVWEN